ncbi:MAG: biotin transport system substrate-specific component [Acidobacteriota bacterium]|jgi:biotin transport system substrate-specific component|nr:biotin transport system substrate-specific component [Acidobacteriota bacterium]
MSTYAKAETLVGVMVAPLDWTRSAALVVGFSLLTALAAQVVVPLPFTPVPLTAQTFAVLLTGALLGPRLGALAMLAYLAEGAAGLPFFRAGTGGVQQLSGVTAGYLFAFPAAAFVTGLLAERGWDRRFTTAAAAMALGSVLILAGGWAWLALMFRTGEEAFRLGVAPFIVGDVVKIALAAAALPSGWALLRRTGQRGA